MDSSQPRVLVTGASSGIGFEVATDFVKRGAVVGAHYRSNFKGAKRLLDIGDSKNCKLLQADFSNSQEVISLWNEFISWTGGIDVLVNNAGVTVSPKPLAELTEDGWDATFQVNVKAPFLLSREALRLMVQQNSGSIVNVSSIGVKFGGGQNTIHYSASKAALESVTRSLAKAGAPYNVRVNAVRAGVTDTDMHRKLGREKLEARASLIPLGRIASPKEIAEAIMFLSSEQSSYVTGTIMPVSGGELKYIMPVHVG